MNVLNRDDVQRALDRIVSKTSWNVDAIIDEAEKFAMENGYTDRDFAYEDGDAEYYFECVKPATYVYDEDGGLDYGNDDSEYWLWLMRDKKTGHDIYRKHSPQYEEMFKGTRKASANKAQGVKADEKKEVFVYKAMDVNGNGVFKVFYDDGTYEILKGGRASERKFNDYDKRVSMETLRHATAPPKGKARRASAQKVRAALSKEKAIEIAKNLYWGVRDYGDVVEFELSSPAGEDFVFSVDADNVADNVWEYAQNFDVEEHVQEVMEMDGAPGLRELLEDAEEIRGMLEELATALLRADGDTDKEGVEGSARRKSGARRVARKKVRAKADNVVDVADLAQFIESAVRILQTSDATNVRYILDENLAVYVGWSYDESSEYGIHNDSGDAVIYAGVKLRSDAYWADYDWLDYPYDKETGDVWDNGSYISPDEDYDYLARELSNTYQEILKEVASGHDLGYGVDDYIDESVESSARRRNKKNVNADLKIICDLGDYQPWQGAVETYNRIKDAGMLDDFERLMEEVYPEGLTMTGLNDILWFEPEWVFEMLGMDNGDGDDEYDEYED